MIVGISLGVILTIVCIVSAIRTYDDMESIPANAFMILSSMTLGALVTFISVVLIFLGIWSWGCDRVSFVDTETIGQVYENDGDYYTFEKDSSGITRRPLKNLIVVQGYDSVNVLQTNRHRLVDTLYWDFNDSRTSERILITNSPILKYNK
tara:strand:- start:3773 stop:4225 length:453 start_codon:yes stop_codon:yes gene_type:complete